MYVNSYQNCFWLFRYLERAEILARKLLAGYSFNLDNHTLLAKEEDPLLFLSTDKALFLQLYPHKQNDNELVHYFLTWQEVNPNSLFNAIKNARENAKLIRNIIGENIWHSINKLYLWLTPENVKNLYLTDRYVFYANFLRTFQLIKGFFYNSLMQDVHASIMEIGLHLERGLEALYTVDYLATNHFADDALLANDKYFHLIKLLLENHASLNCFLKMHYQFNISGMLNFLLFEKVSPYSLITNLHKIEQAFGKACSYEPEFFSKEQLAEARHLKANLEAMKNTPLLSTAAERHKIYLGLTNINTCPQLSSQNIVSSV